MSEKQHYGHNEIWSDSWLSEADELRIKSVEDRVHSSTRSVADLGCGNGMFVNSLSRNRPTLDRIVGIDRSKAALKHVRTESIASSIDNIALPDLSFDTVTCLEVLEHLPQNIYLAALQEIARLAKRQVIITVPYRENLWLSQSKCPQCHTWFSPFNHVRSFSGDDLANLLNEHGFECLSVQPLGTTVTYVDRHVLKYAQRWRDRGSLRPSAVCPPL